MKRLLATCCLIMALGVVAYGGDLEEGRDALNAGKNAKALKLFDAHVKKNPNDPAGYIARGEAFSAIKNRTKAQDDFSKAITLDPKSAEAYQGRAKLLFTLGQWNKALDDIDEAIFLKPTGEPLARCLVLRGHIYERIAMNGDPYSMNDALTDYQSAVAADSKMAWAYSYRGLALLQKHGLGGTLSPQQLATAPLDPKMDREQLLKAAFADLDKGVELAPRYSRVYALRAIGRLSVAHPDHKDAIQRGLDDIAKAIEFAPRKPDAFEVRAMYAVRPLLQTSVMQRADGTVVMMKSFKGEPAKVQQVLDDLSTAIQYGSTSPEIYRLRAEILESKGEHKLALQDWHLACQYDFENGQAWNDLAWRAATHWNPDVRNGTLAVTAAKNANSCPHCKNPYWLDTLAAAYAATGEFVKAIEVSQKAIKHLRPSETAQRASFEQRLKLYTQNKPFHMEAPKK